MRDVIVPQVFAPYALLRTTQLSAVISSGIVGTNPFFDNLAASPGTTVEMPFWDDLTGDSEVLSDTTPLTPQAITAHKDAAATHNRGKAFGANDLVKLLAGADPMAAIGDLVGEFWSRNIQAMLLKSLDGLFNNTAGVLRTTHRVNPYQDVAAGSITDAMRLTAETFIDGTVKIGDHSPKIIGCAMHSEVEAMLRKRDLIETLPDSQGQAQLLSFQGRRVIVDDTCPKVAGTNSPAYTTYLFGRGAFAFGNAHNDPNWQYETGREILASNDLLVIRKRFIIHPRGVRWSGTPAGQSPTDTEIATAANWTKVYPDKHIRIIAIRHNV